ncbi:MAG: hypothetical protein ACI9OF_003031 [Saprospiraceae bacterium]|jgi:hypothetical protein
MAVNGIVFLWRHVQMLGAPYPKSNAPGTASNSCSSGYGGICAYSGTMTNLHQTCGLPINFKTKSVGTYHYAAMENATLFKVNIMKQDNIGQQTYSCAELYPFANNVSSSATTSSAITQWS